VVDLNIRIEHAKQKYMQRDHMTRHADLEKMMA